MPPFADLFALFPPCSIFCLQYDNTNLWQKQKLSLGAAGFRAVNFNIHGIDFSIFNLFESICTYARRKLISATRFPAIRYNIPVFLVFEFLILIISDYIYITK